MMQSNNNNLKLRLIEALDQFFVLGFALTPLLGNKAPYRDSWQTECALSKSELIREINSGRCKGLGIRTGSISGGIVAVDLDGSSAHPKMLELSGGEELPLSVAFTSGRSGRCQYLFRIPEQYRETIHTKKFKTGVFGDDGKPEQVELRWDGCQSVLPPSVHPTTGQYYWVEGCAPWETEIALAPRWLIELMLVAPTVQKQQSPMDSAHSATCPSSHSHTDRWTDIEWALSYLNALASSRSDDYDQWLAVGMALHSVDDSLLVEWDSWSQQSPKYKVGDCEKKWKSFKRSGVSIGTLAHMAKQDGWRSPFSERQQEGDVLPPSSGHSSGKQHKPSAIARIKTQPVGFDPQKTPDDWETFTAAAIAADVITNPKQRIFTLKRLAAHWKVPVSFIESVISDLHTPSPGEEKPKYYSLSQFLNQSSKAQDWIVPGLIYRGGLFILSGRSKIGKSLLFTDITMAGMEGGSLGDMCSVKPLKILVVTTDEGTHETIDKLIKRGFDDLEDCDDRLRFMTVESGVSMNNLQPLEEQLEDFHPDLVLMDSLRTLSRDSAVSENEAAFGKPLKQVKDLMERYNAGCILIHHDTKDPLMSGVDCLSGSTAIASHSSGWMRMIAQNPKDERDPHRILIVGNSRGGDPFRYLLKINPDGKWIDSGCFEYQGEIGDEGAADTKAMLDRVIAFLNRNRGTCYAATELHNLLGGNMDTLFKALSKGVKMELICRRKEAREFRRVRGRRPWLYFLPGSSGGDGYNPGGNNPPISEILHTHTFFPPIPFQKLESNLENIDPVSDRFSGTNSGIISVMPQVPENIPVKTLPIPEIQIPATQSNPAIFGTDSHVDGKVCLTEEVEAILELMQSVYTTGDMQVLEEEMVQLGITPEQKQLIWGQLDKETQQWLRALHQHLKLEREASRAGLGFGAKAPEALRPLATTESVPLTQTQASTSSQACLTQAETEEPATQNTELAPKIQVGSQVYWDNCPGHFASWNPFTVTAIEGDSARLDFVAVLVPVAELRRVE